MLPMPADVLDMMHLYSQPAAQCAFIFSPGKHSGGQLFPALTVVESVCLFIPDVFVIYNLADSLTVRAEAVPVIRRQLFAGCTVFHNCHFIHRLP